MELLGRDDGVDVDIVVLDDFSNSSPAALDRVEQITGRRPELVEGDVRDEDLVAGLLADHRIEAVIHFAAKKAVGESSAIPWEYYDVNVNGTLRLLTAMRRTGVRQLVFSSSCSLYGAGYRGAPLSEADSCAPTNPYARTKLTCERLLADACDADPDLRVISLRYFNPVGIRGCVGPECPDRDGGASTGRRRDAAGRPEPDGTTVGLADPSGRGGDVPRRLGLPATQPVRLLRLTRYVSGGGQVGQPSGRETPGREIPGRETPGRPDA